MEDLNELWSILGLSEGATPGDVVDKVRTLATATAANRSGEPDPSKYVPMALFEETVRALNANNAGLTDELATERVDTATRKGQLPPFLREFGLSMCRRDPRLFDDFVSKTKGASYRADGLSEPLGLDRRPPSPGALPNSLEQEIAARLGVSPEAMARIKVRDQ